MSGIVIPTATSGSSWSISEMKKANWPVFMGFSNRHQFPRGHIAIGGPVNFGDHIGRPLSDKLWEDLVFRLRPSTLEIYNEGSEINTIGRSHAVIIILHQLDGETVVRDIQWFPGLTAGGY